MENQKFTPIALDLEEGKNYAWCSCGLSKKQPFCDGSHQGSGKTPKIFTVQKTGKYHLCTCKKSANAPFCDGSHNK